VKKSICEEIDLVASTFRWKASDSRWLLPIQAENERRLRAFRLKAEATGD
jgi:hypothetical protein